MSRSILKTTGIVTTIALAVAGGLIIFLSSQQGKVVENYHSPKQRVVKYGFHLTNKTGTVIPRADLWVHGPVARTSSQQAADIQASHDFIVEADRLGQQVLHFSFSNFPPYGNKLIDITAKVFVGRHYSPGNKPTIDWLGEQTFVESNNSKIKAKAKELRAEDDMATMRAIYDFVSNHLDYSGYAGREKGALAALEEQKGDCTEYASLVVALCRANNIPARYLGGYVTTRDRMLRFDDYHNWSEAYANGKWHIIDAQERKFGAEAEGYIAMEIITADNKLNSMRGRHRFHIEGPGLRATMQR